MAHTVDILEAAPVTHDVRCFKVERPAGYTFKPGQATDVSPDREGWRDEKRPFTFTSLPQDPHLEFTIKIYPDHDGVTEQLGSIERGSALLIEDPWGTIEYNGKGTFIAGGAGITPFLAILRDLRTNDDLAGHRLIFANKTKRDIICHDELEAMDGLATTHILSDEQLEGYAHGRIDKDWLAANVEDFDQNFYVCGPPAMNEDITAALKDLGASPNALTFEE